MMTSVVDIPDSGQILRRAYSRAPLLGYTFKQRLIIRLADVFFYVVIQSIGSTIRWQVKGWENWKTATANTRVPIYVIWHNRVFLATYFFKHRGIVVMTSRSFDGEYIARFIRRFGYGVARGSSTRGGTRALRELIKLMEVGCPAAFTMDGPKGPRYVAKMGAVLLAKKSGQPLLPFSITPSRFLKLRSWDEFQVPLPFTRALLEIAPPIFVPEDADEEGVANKLNELQHVLGDLTERGEQWRGSN
ncbi:MAG: lysophospholipid acyltransferase family protein [Pyrinomonadaceae bacterium]